jgi:hypothetical protein
MTYHNVQTFMATATPNPVHQMPGTQGFDDWLEEVLTRETPVGRVTALTAWDKAASARDAHPREEHLLPLHVVVGAAGFDPRRRMLKDVVIGAVESAFQFSFRPLAPRRGQIPRRCDAFVAEVRPNMSASDRLPPSQMDGLRRSRHREKCNRY